MPQLLDEMWLRSAANVSNALFDAGGCCVKLACEAAEASVGQPAILAPGATPTEQKPLLPSPAAIAAQAVPCVESFTSTSVPMHEPATSNLVAPLRSATLRSKPSSLMTISTPLPV
jgi:hypothetical protein